MLFEEATEFTASVVMIHIEQRVTARDEDCIQGKMPFELVELGGEGIGQDEVVVDELAIRATGAIRDAPTQGRERARQDLANAAAVLQADFIGVNVVTETAGFDDGEEAPADLGFFLLGEFDRDDAGGEGLIHESPHAFTNPGGIHNDVLRMPGLGEGFQFAEDRQKVLADPTMAGDNMVGGMTERFHTGGIDPDDG